MATATWPFNQHQISELCKTLNPGVSVPDGWGLNGEYGGPKVDGEYPAGASFTLLDPTGSFTDVQIQAAIDATIHDRFFGYDPQRVDLIRDAVPRLKQIRESTTLSNAQQTIAIRRLAAIMERILVLSHARNEGNDPVVEP